MENLVRVLTAPCMFNLDNCAVMKCAENINLNDPSNTIAELLDYAKPQRSQDCRIRLSIPLISNAF